MSATRPLPRRERMRSSMSCSSLGGFSEDRMICLFCSTSELKVKKNSSWLASLPQMNCTSSTISTSTLRNSSLNWPVFLVRSAWMKRFTKLSAVR